MYAILAVELLADKARAPVRRHHPGPIHPRWLMANMLSVSTLQLGNLKQVARVAKPDTILAWYRRLIAQKFDGSKYRAYPGRPRVGREVTDLIVRMARENSGWGYDRIVGALANLGYVVSEQTVGNILRRYGIVPAPKRRQTTTWKQFIAAHMAVLAGIDFFTVEVLTWRGLATYYLLFFLQLETRRVTLGGITRHPTEMWMEQVARNAIDEASGHLRNVRYVLHDRDTKFCASFRATLATAGVKCITLPPRSPNLTHLLNARYDQ
jgi:putative transposase